MARYMIPAKRASLPIATPLRCDGTASLVLFPTMVAVDMVFSLPLPTGVDSNPSS
jgi:hypothetical protein